MTLAQRLIAFDALMIELSPPHRECMDRASAPGATVGNSGCRCDGELFREAVEFARESVPAREGHE